MEIHPPVLAGVIRVLEEVFILERHAEHVVENQIKKNKKWGARDRRQFAETTYEIVRWWRFLQWQMQLLEPTASVDRIQSVVQFYFLKGKSLIPTRAGLGGGSFCDRESYPDELYDECMRQRASDAECLLKKMNQPAWLYLRVNTLKISDQKLLEELERQGVVAERIGPGALVIKERKNVLQTIAFKSGYFEIQDLGSQQIAPFLEAKSGEQVIDACAGGGGKTLHLAALMQNKGEILALDIHASKLDELQKRAARAGAAIIKTKLIESKKTIEELRESADCLLLDVPCSGLGVIRRKPGAKWQFSVAELSEYESQQREILNQYSKMLKVGGHMVYATCSILPSENQNQVLNFIQQSEGRFKLLKEMHVTPLDLDADGFYAARLLRV